MEDLCRRFRNTSPSLLGERMEQLVVDFNVRMAQGDHSQKFRLQVTEDAVRKYRGMMEADQDGTKKLYRDRKEITVSRKENKYKRRKRGGSKGEDTMSLSEFSSLRPVSWLKGYEREFKMIQI